MMRSINSFLLPPHARYRLISCGYTTVEDIINSTVEEICKDTGLLQEEVLDVLKSINTETSNKSLSSYTAFHLLQQESSCVSTFCHQLDEILGGGIPLTKLIEICGLPGVGKTQMGLQLCINAQLPKQYGGLNGESILIDTEGSFVIERLIEIASAAINFIASQNSDTQGFSVDYMLKNVHIYHCKTYAELLSVITILPDFLKQHSKVCLIVIDSIAFHFRYGFDGNYSLRTKLLCGMAQSLIKLASEQKLAVILTNQMTTKFNEKNKFHLMPSLGESWGHICTVRIILYWKENTRWALLLKSPWKEEAVIPFQITMEGIRDIEHCQPSIKRNQSPCTFNQSKKSKYAD